MTDNPASSSPSAPDFTKAAMGAMGDVNNVYDASQHTANHTTNHSTSTSHTHHEDKRVKVTVNNGGISHKVLIAIIVGVFAILCVVIAGFLLQTLALRSSQTDAPTSASLMQEPTSTPTPVSREEKEQADQAPKPSGTPKTVQTAPPAPEAGTTPAPLPISTPEVLQVVFDREDRLYYDKDKQAICITLPRSGYLYAASVWADGQMRILCHPALLEPSPGPVEAGRRVDIPTINMSFTPPDPAAEATEEEIRVVLSDHLVPGIPAERKADIRLAWEAAFGVEIGSPHERMRVRGGELPEPSTRKAAGILQYTAPYRMRRGTRPAASPAP